MEPVTIREATAADAQALIELIRGLAAFEKLEGPDAGAAARFTADLQDPRRLFRVFVADGVARVIGYALYFFTYSTFHGQPKLYIEDLFVHPEHRSNGVGRALFLACAREAARAHCCHMEWAVLDWNVRAQRFYRRLGGAHQGAWLTYSLSEETLARLATAEPPAGTRIGALA